MKAEKIVWCEVKSCPHLIDGQCFADELKLGYAGDSIGFHCLTLLDERMKRFRDVSKKLLR